MTTRYDWSSAPEWARYAATDPDGAVFWYENEPAVSDVADIWVEQGGKYERSDDAMNGWKQSLEARP